MPRYTDKQLAEGLRAAGGMVYVAARQIGCSPDTIKARMAKSPKLQAVKDAENEFVLDTAELKLKQAILAGESWAVKYALSTKGKQRGYVERVEQNVGGTVTHEHKHRYEDREQHFERLFAALDAERARADGDSRAGREALRVDTNGAGAKAT